MSYLVAREYMERALAVAQAAGDRAECRLIQRRICEVIEWEDLDEARRRRDPNDPNQFVREVADPPDGGGDHRGDGAGHAGAVAPMSTMLPVNALAAALAFRKQESAALEADLRAVDAPAYRLRYLGDPIITTPCTPVMAPEDMLQHEVAHLDGRLIVDGLSRQLRPQAERAGR